MKFKKYIEDLICKYAEKITKRKIDEIIIEGKDAEERGYRVFQDTYETAALVVGSGIVAIFPCDFSERYCQSCGEKKEKDKET